MHARIRLPLSGTDTINMAADALTVYNRLDLSRRSLPSLYDSGVRYRPEGSGLESWQTAAQTLRSGHGDCEDLCCWRAAEIPGAIAVAIRTGPRAWHVVVRMPDGSVEDPSLRLGMRMPDRVTIERMKEWRGR